MDYLILGVVCVLLMACPSHGTTTVSTGFTSDNVTSGPTAKSSSAAFETTTLNSTGAPSNGTVFTSNSSTLTTSEFNISEFSTTVTTTVLNPTTTTTPFVTTTAAPTLNSTNETALGKVYIGVNDNDTTELYSFNVNYDGLSIPVYIKMFNETTGQELNQFPGIPPRLECELSPNWSGYSSATFSTSTFLPPFTDSGQVPFSNLVPGRVNEVRCYGESSAPSSDGPPQFTKDRSISDPRLFEVRQAGQVYILPFDVSVVPEDGTQSFVVGLSEVVEDYNVTVVCQQQTDNRSKTCRDSLVDLAFIVDGSGSICDNDPSVDRVNNICNNWRNVRSFLASIVRNLNIGPSKARVALATFANDGILEWNLAQFGTKNALLNAISNLAYPGGNTNTYEGLRIMRTEIFGGSPGDRPNVRKVAIVVTDGLPTRNMDQTEPEAQSAQSEGIQMISVGVTQEVDETPAEEIKLSFFPKRVYIGDQRAQVTYSLIQTGSPASVSCVAQSDPPGKQFINDTSPGAVTQFSVQSITVDLFPAVTTLRTIAMNAYLVLDPAPSTEVVFSCTLTEADNATHAEQIANNASCEMPASATRPPTNITTTPSMVTFNDSSESQLNSTDLTTAPPTSTGTTTTTTTLPTLTSTLSSTTTTVAPPGNITGEWLLQQNVITFNPSDVYQIVQMYRTLNVETPTEEMLVLRCCTPEADNPANYANLSASMFSVTYLTPYQSINFTSATLPADSEVSTQLLNPAYVNPSPCPCDMTNNTCDVDCCCDPGCTDDEKQTFSACVPGIYGGFGLGTPETACASNYSVRPQYFQVMCIQWNSTAYLGHFTDQQSILRDKNSYDASANQYRLYDYKNAGDRFPKENGSETVGYYDGISVKTGLPDTTLSETVNYGYNYRLTLPQRSLAGGCVWTAPVRYVVDSYDTCVVALKESQCSGYTSLSALMFAQSARWSGAKGMLVLQQQGDKVVTATDVNYLCADSADEYTSSYKRSATTFDDMVTPDQSYLFNYTLPTVGGVPDCSFDPDTGAYVCADQKVGASTPSASFPPRCSWDDSFTKPPAPTYDNVTGVCSNAVLRVHYNFTWQGTEIVFLNATLILANISMTTASAASASNATVLSQVFDVKFVNLLGNINDTSGNETIDYRTPQYQRSGNPGYNFDRPIISGQPVYDENTTAFTYMDMNETSQLSLWSPGPDGLCYNAGRNAISFGYGAISSCSLRLGLSDLMNCDYLRKLVLNRQDSMMPSQYISLVGGPDPYAVDPDWTAIFREDLSSIIGSQPSFPTTGDYNFSTEADTTPSSSDATTEFSFGNESSVSYLGQLSGICPNIPSGINVDVMYAKAGESNGVSFYQVVGAQITYTLSTWSLQCTGPGALACLTNATGDNGTEYVQSFSISTTANFILVPSQPPDPPTLYKQQHTDQDNQCHQDACWNQLFYPFMRINPGSNPQYTVSLGLIFLIFFGGYLLISRPASEW